MARPTKYKPQYCKILEKIISEGGFNVTFCAEIGIAESTFYLWLKQFPKFLEAYKRGKAKAKAVFLDKLQRAAFGEIDTRVNNGLISLLAVNLFDMRSLSGNSKESAKGEEYDEDESFL